MRIIEGIYWGIMWEVHLTHQVATIIFLYFFCFLVLASHWQRERERNGKYPRCFIKKKGSFRESLLLLHWQGRLRGKGPRDCAEDKYVGWVLLQRHFQPNPISAEESEIEKHKCVDINTWQGAPLNVKQCWCVGSLHRHQKNQTTVLCFFSIEKFLSRDTLFLW